MAKLSKSINVKTIYNAFMFLFVLFLVIVVIVIIVGGSMGYTYIKENYMDSDGKFNFNKLMSQLGINDSLSKLDSLDLDALNESVTKMDDFDVESMNSASAKLDNLDVNGLNLAAFKINSAF